MTSDPKHSRADEPTPDTPGKPKDSGSRQQRTPGQSTHSGSHEQNRPHEKKDIGGTIPPGPK